MGKTTRGQVQTADNVNEEGHVRRFVYAQYEEPCSWWSYHAPAECIGYSLELFRRYGGLVMRHVQTAPIPLRNSIRINRHVSGEGIGADQGCASPLITIRRWTVLEV